MNTPQDGAGSYEIVPQQNTTSNTPFPEHTFPPLRYSAVAQERD